MFGGRGLLARVGVVAALLLGCSTPPRTPRNVVVVCIDTLRLDRASAFGAVRPTTPFLSRLRSEGTYFTAVQSSSNWTVPAVASLMTGLLPARHGAVVPGDPKELGRSPEAPDGILPGPKLLAQGFSERGFGTALVSGNPYLYGRFKDGFDFVRVDDRDGSEQWPEIDGWLRSNGERPFFLYWQIMDLHQPLDPPSGEEAAFLARPRENFPTRAVRDWAWGNLEDPSNEAFRTYREEKLALYDATLRHVDGLLERLTALLREMGELDSTLLVVTSDHGEEFWDHAEVNEREPGDPRGIWGIGHGHSMYQELLHVPILIRGRGIPAGRVVTCPVGLVDVPVTLVEQFALPFDAGLDGRSLSRFMLSKPAACSPRVLVSEAPAYGRESSAVRVGRWKLSIRSGSEPRLFDLSTDPEERESLARKRPDLVASLVAELENRALADPTRAEPPELTEELRRQLKSLGYLP